MLKVHYSGERELMGDILRHGAEVQVIGSHALRQKVQKAIAQALKMYNSYK